MAHQTYDELEWHLRRLHKAYKAGKLVFLLGAGINTEYGLPDWGLLLVKLLRKSGRLHPASATVADQRLARIIETVIADPLLQAATASAAYADRHQWIQNLRELLSIAPDALNDRSKPLGRIAHILANQYKDHPQSHVAVLTFNYDDLIEQALRLELGDAAPNILTSVSTPAESALANQRPGIYVYHLHGSLDNPQSEIVLDAHSYVKLLAAPANHWSWSCMNSLLFQQDSGVMFLGLSLLDPSLRLLLTRHAANGMPLSAVFVGKPLEMAAPSDPQDCDLLKDCLDLVDCLHQHHCTHLNDCLHLTARFARLDLNTRLNAAFIGRDVQTLFDEVLEELSLIPYHVGHWSEISDLLTRVSTPKG